MHVADLKDNNDSLMNVLCVRWPAANICNL